MKKVKSVFAVLFFLVFWGINSYGIADAPLFSDLQSLVKTREFILIGKVKEITGDQAKIAVRQVIKGTIKDKEFSVRCDNNKKGWVEDPIRYNPGEQVLFFLDFYEGYGYMPFPMA